MDGVKGAVTFGDLPLKHQKFYEKNVCLTLVQATELCNNTRYQANKLWHDERRKRLTASISYHLYTYSKNKNQDWPTKIMKHRNSVFW